MSALSETISGSLVTAPMQFSEVIDAHRDSAWREFLQAWGELREENILKRDDIGRYYIPGGPAEAIAAVTKME